MEEDKGKDFSQNSTAANKWVRENGRIRLTIPKKPQFSNKKTDNKAKTQATPAQEVTLFGVKLNCLQ